MHCHILVSQFPLIHHKLCTDLVVAVPSCRHTIPAHTGALGVLCSLERPDDVGRVVRGEGVKRGGNGEGVTLVNVDGSGGDGDVDFVDCCRFLGFGCSLLDNAREGEVLQEVLVRVLRKGRGVLGRGMRECREGIERC